MSMKIQTVISVRRERTGYRNINYNNVYKTQYQSDSAECDSLVLCVAKCIEEEDCASIAFNKKDGRCQMFYTYFTSLVVSGVSEDGWHHFDVRSGR